ncbi:DUF551 domain-containing protein (plasmid) [Erwinia tracheiphila]|uniref:DUF551 domain-containing protein n=1 Tax=Erwinia tracheiphila TaxID=65700 RepID=UPI001F1E73FA|nr:DUF551 domain-containing protein [Erwinia tracheiphila]UIA94534.1 DUF551 domain-containing protein [Erwinia tracheiphila]
MEWTQLDFGKYPPDGEEVLVCDERGKRFICYHEHGFWKDFCVGYSKAKITHWMPIPQPPCSCDKE